MSVPPNPILATKYNDLRAATDPISQKIVSNMNYIYDQAVIFNSATDIPTMDNSIINIQEKFVEIKKYAEPCASLSNTDKCTTAICNSPPNLVKYIETIYIDLIIFFQSLPTYTASENSNYTFLLYLIMYDFTNMITSNPSNRDIYNDTPKYYLCSGTSYEPHGLSPSQSGKFAKLISKSIINQKATTARNDAATSINFLLYILLPSVVFIVLILLYIRNVRQAKIDDEDMNFALNNIRDSKK
jgi:hypothetical protein